MIHSVFAIALIMHYLIHESLKRKSGEKKGETGNLIKNRGNERSNKGLKPGGERLKE